MLYFKQQCFQLNSWVQQECIFPLSTLLHQQVFLTDAENNACGSQTQWQPAIYIMGIMWFKYGEKF